MPNLPPRLKTSIRRASFFLGNSLLDSYDLSFPEVVSFPAFNISYTCRACGDTWGRFAVDEKAWHIVQSFCPKHTPLKVDAELFDIRHTGLTSPPWVAGGSFLQATTITPDRLSPKLLTYEFNLWMNLYEYANNRLCSDGTRLGQARS